jgi:hypothetical protein
MAFTPKAPSVSELPEEMQQCAEHGDDESGAGIDDALEAAQAHADERLVAGLLLHGLHHKALRWIAGLAVDPPMGTAARKPSEVRPAAHAGRFAGGALRSAALGAQSSTSSDRRNEKST